MPDPMGDFSFTWPFYLGALLAYLLGSIPFGLVLTRMAGYGDIREIGSKSIGATNVLRTGNKALAALTVILDSGKGAVAVLIASTFYGTDMAIIAAGASVLGHCFPVWLKFKGGKGVATTIGVVLALNWMLGLTVCATWLVVALLFRYSSLAGLLSIAAAPAYAKWIYDPQIMEVCGFIAVLVWVRHWQNILRLLKGEESRIKLKKSE